jgi:uncharacterized protein YmfQ (DUF2313 family)
MSVATFPSTILNYAVGGPFHDDTDSAPYKITSFRETSGNYPHLYVVSDASSVVSPVKFNTDAFGTTSPIWYAWDKGDGPGANFADSVEILGLVKLAGTLSSGVYYPTFYVNAAGKGNGYYVAFYNGSPQQVTLWSGGGGSPDYQIGSYNFSFTTGAWYWVRLNYGYAGGHTATAKVWPLGSAEPGSPNISVSNTDWNANYCGLIFQQTSAKPEYAYLSAGTGGATAPGGLIFQQVAASLALTSGLSARAGQRYLISRFAQLDVHSTLNARFSQLGIKISAALIPRFGAALKTIQIVKWPTVARISGMTFGLSCDTHVIRYQPRDYPGDRYRAHDAADYAEAYGDLLPQGLAWPRDIDSVLQKTVRGLTKIWGDVVDSAASLMLTQESDPRKTVILLPDWERAWGLPDECLAEPLSITDRQAALVDKITMNGAQSREFFIERAKKIGYPIHIREFAPFMAGVSQAGDTRNLDDDGYWRWEIGDPSMRFYWVVRIQSRRYTWFRAGSGQAGINHHLEFAHATDLECMLRRWKPAHTDIIFDYSPLASVDISQTNNTDWLMVLSMM